MAGDDGTFDAIIQLKESLLKRDRDEAFDSDSSDSQIPSNRGRKFKRKAAHVNLDKLTSYDDGPVLEIVEYANKRRAVVRKKSTPVYEDDHNLHRDDEDEDEDDDEDPYQGIDLDNLLSPITHPSQLPNHPAISKAYTRTTLATLSRRALDFICTETTKQAQMGKLLSLFLGDDGRFIKSDDLNLPSIQLPSVPIGTIYPRSESQKQRQQQQDSAPSDSQIKVNGLRRTRNQASGDLDPFYALPTLNVNRDVGCPPEFAEEMRQLADLAVQKSEEYTRCLVQVRMGLLRADRYRRKVYKWCREIGGELSDDDDDYDVGSTSNTTANLTQQKAP